MLYTDAYFLDGERRKRPHELLQQVGQHEQPLPMENGWGAVIFPMQPHLPRVLYCAGRVPSNIVTMFSSRRAYIYFLEAWAHIGRALAFSDIFRIGNNDHDRYLCFIDNEAAKHALIKGYGKDLAVNNLLAIYWAHHALLAFEPWLHRVTTQANIADEISRMDFSRAEREHWTFIPLDLQEAYVELQRCCNDQHRAHTTSHAVIGHDLRSQVARALANSLRTIPELSPT